MQSITLNVEGMTCQGCVNAISTALKQTDGIKEVQVSLENHHATINFDPTKIQTDQIKQSIEEAGFEVVN